MTGPKNLSKRGNPQMGKPRVKASRAPTPRVRPAKASAGVGRPPAGGGSGTPKSTTSMAGPPKRTINKPKTTHPGNTRRVAKQKSDLPSRI